MNRDFPFEGTIINADTLDNKLEYVLEFAGHGGMRGSLTKAVLYSDIACGSACKCKCGKCRK